MVICPRCASAIRQLHSQGWLSEREDREVAIELPILDHAGVNSCWICSKFSTWLEAEVPRYLDEWRRQSLQVKFTVFGRIYREEPQPDIPLLLLINISPLSLKKDYAACELELNFMTATGTVNSLELSCSVNISS